MYRPNRIGPHPVFDLDAALLSWPAEWAANFNTGDHDNQGAPRIHVGSATLREDYDQVTWIAANDVILAADNAIAFGVAIDGNFQEGGNLGHLYCGHVSAVAGLASGTDLLAVPIIGRCNSSTVIVDRTGAGNVFGNVCYLPGESFLSAGMSRCSWQGCIAQGNLGAAALGTNPVMLGGLFVNYAGASVTFEYLVVTATIHKYVAELQVFDPVR